MILGTTGDDFLFFMGTVQQVTMTLVNPYSSKSYDIDDLYNVNDTSYDGLTGIDSLIFSSFGDFLSLTDNVGVRLVQNIEEFAAGRGGDIINLADSDVTYGNVSIFGGRGDDILWSNVGDDFIDGALGNDIIDGGPGNDELLGGGDNDQIFGGEGDDILLGEEGDDILYGGTDLALRDLDQEFLDTVSFPDLVEGTNIVDLVPPGTPALGIDNDNLTLEFDGTATLTFRHGFAGYNNSLGIYRIADDGTIQDASILWGNVKTAGFNTSHTIDLPLLPDGGEFGFFIIANGDRRNDSYDGLDIATEGNIRFVYDFGGVGERDATVTDDGSLVSTVYDDGTTVLALSGPDYHTTTRGGDNSINGDGKTHAVSGSVEEFGSQVLRIGFEDLPNLGDADFEDVLFDLDIDRIRIDASEVGNDTLNGGAGNDILYGEAGDDLLIIGDGQDEAHGGSGRDTFRFDVLDTDIDTIMDFDDSVGGDVLDLSLILSFDSDTDDVISDFVQLVQNGDDTEIQVDANGDTGVFTAIALVQDGLDVTLTDLINNGNFIG